MFTFDIKHVAGRKESGPDGLSRRSLAPEDSEDEDPEELEASIDAGLALVGLENEDNEDNEHNKDNKDSEDSEDSIRRARSDENEDEDENENENENEDEDEDEEDDEEMPDKLKKIKKYLLTLNRPVGMSDNVYDSFRQFELKFVVHEGLRFFRNKVNIPPRTVVRDKAQQDEIIREMHDKEGHRGKKGTYTKVDLCYWWKGLYWDVDKWVKTCKECQFRARNRTGEELHLTLENALWSKVGVDVVYMPKDAGFSKIVAMRYYLSG